MGYRHARARNGLSNLPASILPGIAIQLC